MNDTYKNNEAFLTGLIPDLFSRMDMIAQARDLRRSVWYQTVNLFDPPLTQEGMARTDALHKPWFDMAFNRLQNWKVKERRMSDLSEAMKFLDEAKALLEEKNRGYTANESFDNIRHSSTRFSSEQFAWMLMLKHLDAVERDIFDNPETCDRRLHRERLMDIANYCAMLSVVGG